MGSLARTLWSREALYAAPILILSVCLIYSPVVQVDFLFRDDCVFFTLPKGWTLTGIALSQARPIQGLIVDILNNSVVSGAGTKHLASVLGLGMLAISVYAWLRSNGLHRTTAMLLGLSLCCLSSFQATVSYLTVCGSIYASLFSCLAVHAFFQDCGNRGQTWRKQIYRVMLASMLLFLGLSCYQPGAMFCWAVLIVPIYLSRSEDWPNFRAVLLRFGLLFGVTIIAYFSFYKAVSLLMACPLSARAQWANPGQILAKLTWFYTWFVPYVGREITRSLHDFTTAQIKFIGPLSLAVAVGGLFCPLGRQGRPFPVASCVQRLGLLPLLLVLCHLPFAVIQEYGADATCTTAIQSSLLLAACLGLRNVLEFATSLNTSRRVEAGLAAILCCLLAITANGNLLRNYAFPNHNEYSYVRSAISKTDLTNITRIHIVGRLNFSDVLSYPEALVRGVLNEVAPPGVHPAITSSSQTAPSVIHSEILGRSAALTEYYEFEPRQGYYTIKPGLTIQQRAALDSYFATQADSVAALPNVLVIDLSKANVAY